MARCSDSHLARSEGTLSPAKGLEVQVHHLIIRGGWNDVIISMYLPPVYVRQDLYIIYRGWGSATLSQSAVYGWMWVCIVMDEIPNIKGVRFHNGK
jgi:hypothetical protein